MRSPRNSIAAVATLLMSIVGCGGAPTPVDIRVGQQPCESCRMLLSDPYLAVQIVARHDEPLFFDDLGCLRQYLDSEVELAPDAIVYVTDHRTGVWVAATSAVFTRAADFPTPMRSHLVAHATEASRLADTVVRDGQTVSTDAVLGPRFRKGREP